MRVVVIALLLLAAMASPAAARKHQCLRKLDELGVRYKRVHRRGIKLAVRVRGKLGGVVYKGYNKRRLVLDCSLVYSLAHAGRFLSAAGVYKVIYSSAYQVRKVRGTSRASRHSYGLAIDLHSFSTQTSVYRVKDDYERGLGDTVDCIGRPSTRGAAALRALACQFTRSQLFRSVLTPDYDAGHYNHFHLEAYPWRDREDLGWRDRG